MSRDAAISYGVGGGLGVAMTIWFGAEAAAVGVLAGTLYAMWRAK